MTIELSHKPTPSGVDWDHITNTGGIRRMTNKTWSPRVDDELGNYDYLLGLDVWLFARPSRCILTS